MQPEHAAITSDQEDMAVCAIRYTIGRQSYIVSQGQAWALRYGAQSKHVRDVIARDLREAVERCDQVWPDGTSWRALGMDQDERGWRDVLAKLEAMETSHDR